uniref:Interleukin-1 n=1 Tax=Laticauda laticaudata TaxID=8630 RepID=A0A8C5RU97_LATLA
MLLSLLPQKAFQTSEVDIQVATTKNEPQKSFRKAVLVVILLLEKGRISKVHLAELVGDLVVATSTVALRRQWNKSNENVFPYSEPVTFNICSSTEATSSIYHFWKNIVYNIQDTDHKSLVFKEPAQLVAMHLQGHNLEQAGEMSVYRPKIEAGTQKVPVVLSIQRGKFYISCVSKDGQPVLQLEEATIQGNLDKSQLGRFLFYKIANGKHTRFESAECPEWFICTSSQNDEAVAVTKQPGGPRVIVDYSLTN